MFDEKRYTEAMINLRGCMDVNMIPEFIETDVKILLRYVGSLEVANAILEVELGKFDKHRLGKGK